MTNEISTKEIVLRPDMKGGKSPSWKIKKMWFLYNVHRFLS